MAAAIEVDQLGKRLGGRWTIEGLSFTVQPGEVFGLLGPNGAGKTTTLRILAGLYAPDAGRVVVAGEETRAGHAGRAAARRHVGLLTEQPGFYDRLEARYNLTLFGQLYGLSAREAGRRADGLLERFGLAAVAEQPFATLSRGMKQKLAIARAILHQPDVVLLDEPTVGLDPEATAEVRRIIGELAAEGRTVVLCTHQLSEVERLCSRAAVLARRLVGVHDVAAQTRADCRVLVGLAAAADGVDLSLPYVVDASLADNQLSVELDDASHVPDLVSALAARGLRITSVTPARNALEAAYLSLLARARDAGFVQ